MFASIKAQLWELLKKKEVSLVMIFDKEGTILWNKGRKIEGKSIHLGNGFSKSFVKRIMTGSHIIQKENVEIFVFGQNLSESAVRLSIKSLIIIPVKNDFFLYVDSGTKEHFSETDIEVFRLMGELLGRIIERVMENQDDILGITGVSGTIKKIRETVIKYSLEEEPVLLIGETGVGKSHIAELIHRYSGREGSFEVAEITSINENLFESTMFGHKKGSFTDAKADKTGLVREADKGTLFIDEISEIPVSFQAKLLRFIDKKKYRVIGDSQEKEADVRIVAASNKDPQKAIKNKEFREDLYYRLHVLEVEIPPLRDRKEDIKDFVSRHPYYLKGKEIGEGFWEAILNHDWPGNMRELITVLKRSGILLESPLTGAKIRDIIYGCGYRRNLPGGNGSENEIWIGLEQGKSFWQVVKEPFLKRDLNREQVKTVLSAALARTNGNYKDTLKIFNIAHSQYTKFMKFLYRNDLT